MMVSESCGHLPETVLALFYVRTFPISVLAKFKACCPVFCGYLAVIIFLFPLLLLLWDLGVNEVQLRQDLQHISFHLSVFKTFGCRNDYLSM